MQKHNMPKPEDHKRMVIFFVLAALIMSLSYVFITKPQMEKAREAAALQKVESTPEVQQAVAKQMELKTVAEALAGKRIPIDADKLQGTISSTGLRFDDIELKDYYTTLENTDPVRLLAPSDTKKAYFVEVGLMPADASIKAPTNDTNWQIVSGDKLSSTTPVVMEWSNGQGVTFRRTITMDRYYVMTVVQSIENDTDRKISFYPYALISQTHHIPVKGEKVSFEDQPSSVQHIGPIAFLNDELEEESYQDLRDEQIMQYANVKGWLGITSKYWLVGLLPKNDQVFDARFAHQQGDQKQDIYQADLRGQAIVVDAHGKADTEMRVFAGAKKLDILTDYEKTLDVPQLDLSIDFGWLYFLTKPLYHFLSFLGSYFHDTFHLEISFALALMTLTILLRLATFPLQNKAYRSMNKMKDLGPKLHALKEKHGEDKVKFQQEVMELYKREKINPANGCLPILIQIPIFFALYKVIYITLDMRHAPFVGWIHDLSSPDPTNIFNLFGLLPFETPVFLAIGAWPLLYGLTMWIQQKLNPQPEDDMQKQIFAMLPWVFTFVFAKFPAGLVIYYTWSNLLGILQQYSLRRLNPGMAPPKKPKKAKKAK